MSLLSHVITVNLCLGDEWRGGSANIHIYCWWAGYSLAEALVYRSPWLSIAEIVRLFRMSSIRLYAHCTLSSLFRILKPEQITAQSGFISGWAGGMGLKNFWSYFYD